jgi:hypothetical protein
MFSKYTRSLAVCCLLLTSTCIASSYRDFYPDDIDETESTAANALEIGNSNINSLLDSRQEAEPIPFPVIQSSGSSSVLLPYLVIVGILILITGGVGKVLYATTPRQPQENSRPVQTVPFAVEPEQLDYESAFPALFSRRTSFNANEALHKSDERPDTENVRQLRLAHKQRGAVLDPLVEVRLKLEEELCLAVPAEMPSTKLRAKLKMWAAVLKLASQEESTHVTEKLAPLFLYSLVAMGSAYLVSLMHFLGNEAPVSPWNPIQFFGGLSENSPLEYLGYLLVPFGWNWVSVIPYFMAFNTITQVFSMFPFVGPLFQRVFYLALFIRFFWKLRISLFSMVILSATNTFFGWLTIKFKWHHWYSKLLCFVLAICAGFLVAYFDPLVSIYRHPLRELAAVFGLADEFFY